MFSKKELKKIPHTCGVYLFKDSFGKVIYVGKALNLYLRVKSYFQKQNFPKNQLLVKEVRNYETVEVASEVEALILEANLVRRFLPKYNLSLRDDKSFLYIVITKEEFPRILTLRKKQSNIPVKYQFGPFPSAQSVRNVLKLIRKVFPYCTQSPKVKHSPSLHSGHQPKQGSGVRNPESNAIHPRAYTPWHSGSWAKKVCFYSHIGLCNPCPSQIRKLEGDQYQILKKIYLTNISNIKKLLEGKFTQLNKQLFAEMKELALEEKFEEADIVNKKLQALEYITKPYYRVSSFLENSNFYAEELRKSSRELLAILQPYFKITNVNRIEGIDISNLSGREATGSLVVFENGQKQPSEYKRFKIKAKGPDDVSMIEEVLQRRMKHQEWSYPDLFLIDGGKPQVARAKQVIREFSNIAVAGLAKKSETIIIPDKNKFISLNLKRNSLSLRLLQEIRDEAHRFARKYHHLLRKKLISTS